MSRYGPGNRVAGIRYVSKYGCLVGLALANSTKRAPAFRAC
jgi:hypothetical protein